MKAEDIVEGLNQYIEQERIKRNIISNSHLVLKRLIEENPSFKAYKTYSITLYFIKGKKKYEFIKVEITDKVVGEDNNSIARKLNIKLILLLLSTSLDKIITGEYE